MKTLTFSDELVVPAGMPDNMSPFMATWGRYDVDEFREDETLRQRLVRGEFQYAERCRAHFERGNWALFDKESPSGHGPVTPKNRLTSLYLFYTAAFMKFTLPTDAERARIRQRLIYVKSAEPAGFDELANYYLDSGRIMSLWREIFSVRTSFVNCYNFIQPLIMVRYWKQEYREPVTLTDKHFNDSPMLLARFLLDAHLQELAAVVAQDNDTRTGVRAFVLALSQLPAADQDRLALPRVGEVVEAWALRADLPDV